MFKKILILLIFSLLLSGEELLIIADKHFKKKSLTSKEVKSIFLAKQQFYQGKRILTMNYKYGHSLRICLEKNILKMSKKKLEKYWRNAYYQGIHPPKIISSTAMIFSYLESSHPSIGYIEKDDLNDQNVTILLSIECSK